MKKLLVTGFSFTCIQLMAQVLQPLGSGLPLPDQIGSGKRVVASFAASDEYLALFNEPSTPDTTDYTVGRWNGAYWSYFPGLITPQAVKVTQGGQYHFTSVVLYHDTMYAAAYIESPTDVQANVNHLYKWNGTQWAAVTNGIGSTNYGVKAMTVFDDKLIVAGRFQNNLSGTIVNNIAAYNGNSWTIVGKSASEQGTDGEIHTLVTEGNRLYIGGTFQKFAGITTGNIAFYTEKNTTWGGIGSPFTGEVTELASFNGKLGALGYNSNSDVEVRIFTSSWSNPVSFADYSTALPNTIAGAKTYLLIGGDFVKDGNGTNLLRFERDTLFTTGNRIQGEFKLGQRGSEAFIWGNFLEQNTNIRYISKIIVDAGDVTGSLFFDADQDCIKGGSEMGLSGVLVRFENEAGIVNFASTNPEGKFAIALPEGNYTISAFPGRHWINNCPTNYAVKVRKGLYSFVSLGQFMQPNTQDLELHLGAATSATVSAGDKVKYVIRLKNSGNTTLNGTTVHFSHPNRLSGFYGSPQPDNYDIGKGEATYTLLDMKPGEIRVYELFLELPSDAADTEKFDCTLKAGSLFTNNDAYKGDNYDTVAIGTQTGPNGSVNKNGTNGDLVDVKITKLDYKVKFTNISESLVNRVVLLDTLDPNIKLKYMRVYDMYPEGDWNIVKVGNRDILVAEYPKANLSTLESNPSSASGYIRYYLQLTEPLKHNDRVHNRASCDFDSKWTGISNTVTVTMADGNVGIRPVKGNIGKLYPNPASEQLHIEFVKPYQGIIELTDQTGRVVSKQIVNGLHTSIDVSGLNSGLYTVSSIEGASTVVISK